MKSKNILDLLEDGKKLAVLIDPDFVNSNLSEIDVYFNKIKEIKPDLILVGGSIITNGDLFQSVEIIRTNFDLPVYLFPGDNSQLSSKADGLLLLSLISGRNAEYLIGQHVKSAVQIKKLNIDVYSTGYILVESGATTSAEYISNTKPIPYNKTSIAVSTALAGELIGNRLIYLDGGSGAGKVISSEMVSAVKNAIQIPLIVGGGITNRDQIDELWSSGANLVVIGTAIETNDFVNI